MTRTEVIDKVIELLKSSPDSWEKIDCHIVHKPSDIRVCTDGVSNCCLVLPTSAGEIRLNPETEQLRGGLYLGALRCWEYLTYRQQDAGISMFEEALKNA